MFSATSKDKSTGYHIPNKDVFLLIRSRAKLLGSKIVFKSKLNPMTGKQDGTINTHVLVFRCIIDGLTDNFSGDWGEQKFVGRPDKTYIYKGFNRELGMNLSIHPTSRVELKPLYDKLIKKLKKDI